MRTPLGPVRAEMFTTAYWTEGDSRSLEGGIPHTDATDLLMDEAAIREFNAAVLADPAFCRTDIYHMALPDPVSRDAFVTYNLTRPAYAKAAQQVRDNIMDGLKAFGNDYKFGVCIARSVLLSLPVEGEWPAYKPYTLSPIHVNVGVIIYSVTADGAWYFVRTAIYYGWVSSKCIALVGSREEMKGYTDYEDFLVVTADHLTVEAQGDSAVYHVAYDIEKHAANDIEKHAANDIEKHAAHDIEKHAAHDTDKHAAHDTDNHAAHDTDKHAAGECITFDMGDRIRLTAYDAQGYHVTVLTKDDDGHVSTAEAIIDKDADVYVGYLPYTQKNLLDQCFKTLDDRYMWGGGEGERDCSSWTMEIFSCFGLIFPRNSERQARIPAYSLKLEGLDSRSKSDILSRLPAGTLIFSPSHVMVYLGRRGNDNYMIHNGGDFCVIKDTGSGTAQDGPPATEKYLTYGVTVMSLEKTTTLEGRVWLDAIKSAVFPHFGR